jgi:imidazoleglycerol-phosphate dehydratase/histidinol-phosphatase
MKKALFIDRDGTLIAYPPDTEQIDTLEKLEFLPKVIRNMHNIRKNLNYEIVMVTNQDGLGTAGYPIESFNKVQSKLLKTLENEEVWFDGIYVDNSFPEDNKPTRKPGTAMLTKFMDGSYELDKCFVIGDRITDIILAKNLGSKAILVGNEDMWEEVKSSNLEKYCSLVTEDWDEIYSFIALPERTARVRRVTDETEIDIFLNLDGHGNSDVSTGLNFFDHMLAQIGKHSGMDMTIEVHGDIDVDEHHTMEDTAIALGEAIYKAIGNKQGMNRYGFVLPMDDCLSQVAIDFGGRSWLVWDVEFKREKIGDVPTEMFFHFFKSFCESAKCNLNIKADGENEHHKIESIFKALARTLKMALKRDPHNSQIPSTKGVL